MDNGLLGLASFASVFWLLVVVLTSFFRFFLGLFSKEAKAFNVLIKSNTGVSELNNVLVVSFTELLVLFGFKNGQFLLLDPFSVELSLLHWSFALIGVADLNSLALVVLFKSKSCRLFGFLLSNNWLFWLGFFSWDLTLGSSLLRRLLDVFIFFELILHVTNVSPTSSFLSGFITKSKWIYTLPVPLLLSR
jgi:hypothetical protein